MAHDELGFGVDALSEQDSSAIEQRLGTAGDDEAIAQVSGEQGASIAVVGD